MPPRETITPESFTTLGELLRHLRHRAQLTQRDLAIAVGYTEAHLSRIEGNRRKVERAVLTARFVPALELEEEPHWVARMLALADDRAPAPAAEPPPPAEHAPLPMLLSTRLHTPPPRRNMVIRERLHQRLAEALNVPLTLIVAPAGFGKSTLLTAWLAELAATATPPVATAWLALAKDNNDLPTFIRYLVAAFRTFVPDAGVDTLALLRSRPAIPALLTPLLNDLSYLDHDCVLTLDDGHVISEPAIYEALAALLDHMPPRLHLVIAARNEPQLPLARLRARGQMIELRAADLRFAEAEAALFLRTTMQLAISDTDIAALDTRAEGWAAGLQLAGLALREAPDQAAFVRAFAGSNRYVIDYLAEEVLDTLPVYLRHFLLQTAVLERMCGALCDAALDVGGDGPDDDSYSRVVLAELERRSLFLIPLDAERRWYRYHHLFAEVLRARLAAGSSRATIAELHRRASLWFHRQGLADEAIYHAVHATDQELLGDLIEQYLALGLSRNDDRVWNWYTQTPPEIITRRPRLALYAVDLLARLARFDEALHLLDTTPALINPPDVEIAAGVLLMRARTLRLRLDEQQAAQWLDDANRLMPAGNGPLQAILALELGLIEGYRRLDVGLAYFDGAIKRFRDLGYDGDAIFSLSQQLMLLFWGGRLHAVRAQAEAAQSWINLTDEALATRKLGILHSWVNVLVEQNRLDEAEEILDLARQMTKGALEWVTVIYMYWHRARYTYARGDAQGAVTLLEEAKETRAQRAGAWSETFIARFLAQAYLWNNDVEAAVAAIQASGDRQSVPIRTVPALPLTMVRVLIAQGRRNPHSAYYAQAHELVERCMAEINPAHRYWLHSAHILAALLAHAHDDLEQALALLAPALAFGETQEFVRLFADEGPPMIDLLRQARARGISPAYCEHLLAAFPPSMIAPAP